MAESDISRLIFFDTVDTIPPNIEKNRIITSSRDSPLLFCLFGLAFMETPSLIDGCRYLYKTRKIPKYYSIAGIKKSIVQVRQISSENAGF